MNPFEKLGNQFRAPPLTRGRVIFAIVTAVLADGLQIALLPLAWTFAECAVDVVAMLLITRAIGFHLLLLPTFAVEFIPVVDMLPTWTGCVATVIALRRGEQKPKPPALLPPAKDDLQG